MAEEIVRLAAEMDVTGARGPVTAARESEAAWSRSSGQMTQSVKRTEQSVLDLGSTTRKIAGLATAGFSAISAGITAARANSDNLESSLVSVGSALTASFLAGGPIGLGIGLLGVSIGLLAGGTDEAAEAAERARVEHERWLQTVQRSADAAGSRVAKLRDEIEQLLTGIAGAPRFGVDQIIAGSEEDKVGKMIADLMEQQRHLKEINATTEDRRRLQERINALMAQETQLASERRQTFVRSALAQILGSVEEGRRLRETTGEVAKLQRLLDGLTIPRDLTRFVLLPPGFRDQLEDAREALFMAQQLAQARENLDRGAGAFESAQRIETIRAKLTEADGQELSVRQEIARLQREINELVKTGGELGAAEARRLSILKQLREEELAAIVAVNEELRRRQQIAGDEALRDEIALLSARNDREREVVRIYQAQRDALDAGRDPGLVAERLRLQLEQLDARQAIDPFLQGLEQTLGQGLTEIIIDGIETGFDNASSIALNIVNTLLRQILSSIVQSGISELMGSVLGGGGGGGIGGIVSTVVGAVAGGGGGIGGGGVAGAIVPAVTGAPAAPC